MKTHATRYPELSYSQPLAKVWRIIDNATGRGIGPFYRTKAELLTDLERFAAVYGVSKELAETESVEPSNWRRFTH